LKGTWNTTKPDESRASMRKRCVSGSNCRLTGNAGDVVEADVLAGTPGLGSPSDRGRKTTAGETSLLGVGGETGGAAAM